MRGVRIKLVNLATVRICRGVLKRILDAINAVTQPEGGILQLLRTGNFRIKPTPIEVGQRAFGARVDRLLGYRLHECHELSSNLLAVSLRHFFSRPRRQLWVAPSLPNVGTQLRD